jgi:lysozyme
MKTSQIGIDLIKFFEGLHDGDLSIIGLQPKMCPAGIWTEGYGRAMRDKNNKFIKGIENKKLAYSRITIRTEAQAEIALKEDLKTFERIVIRKTGIPLRQNEFDALVSQTYNTGGSDTLFRLINTRAKSQDIKNWLETTYITANGIQLAGLVARRKAESKLYFLAR